jgi:glycosyltransferase involved in cell wall biosynthesis
MPRIEIVAAVRSEERTLPGFVKGVRALTLPDDVQLEMLFVEDSSDDETRSVLRCLATDDPSLRYVALEEGFGQGPAVVFGLSRSTADAAIMMDVDGGHPIDVIPEMIERFQRGARVVQCRRRSLRGRPIYRMFGSSAFRVGARLLTGVDFVTQNIYYRLVAADLLPLLVGGPQYWPLLRFPLPSERDGGLVVLDVDADDRRDGETKYGPARLALLAVDGVLALMSRTRLAVLLLLVAGAALVLIASGAWPVGIALLLAAGLAAQRCLALRSAGELSRMRVAECSDAARG